jgi:hypothetical protein
MSISLTNLWMLKEQHGIHALLSISPLKRLRGTAICYESRFSFPSFWIPSLPPVFNSSWSTNFCHYSAATASLTENSKWKTASHDRTLSKSPPMSAPKANPNWSANPKAITFYCLPCCPFGSSTTHTTKPNCETNTTNRENTKCSQRMHLNTEISIHLTWDTHLVKEKNQCLTRNNH